MAIQTTWGNKEKTIILWEIISHWTFEEFMAAGQEAAQLAESITHQFDLVINANNFPPPPFPLQQFKRAMEMAHPRLRYTIFVKANAFSRMIMLVLQQVNVPHTEQENMTFCETMEEALAWLAEKAPIQTESS